MHRTRGRAPSVKDNYTQVRFIKSKKGAINRYHATRNEELKKKLLYLQSIRKEAQDKKVTLCRSYRVGKWYNDSPQYGKKKNNAFMQATYLTSRLPIRTC